MVEPTPVDGTTVSTTYETVTFNEETKGDIMEMYAPYDDMASVDAADSASLANYLSRPVDIDTFTWLESDSIGIKRTISPWQLYMNNAAVKSRINNFAFIRGNLKVKILINASPFYYGAMRVCYQPLPNFTPSTIITDTALRYLIPYSQQPGTWLKPQCNEGSEMVLPFFWPKNWLRLQKNQDFLDMGTLRFINYTQLASANGVTGAGVTIRVQAWLEDVVISGPSVGLAMQAGDEYGTGAVSRPASAIANVAGLLKGVPIIGRFATATQMGASAVSSIAKLFGWTNVPVIKDVDPLKPLAIPPIASTEIGYPVEKLTLDSKNELSVDPTTVGLANTDDLVISEFVQRDSFICQTTWDTSQASDTILYTSLVTPFQFDIDPTVNNTKVYFTPVAYIAKLFGEWRGDLIFRFHFVASPYHKGRVRISYDPQGYPGTTISTVANTSNLVFTQIVDLGAEQDVEIRVPYQQALAWLAVEAGQTVPLIPWSISNSPTQVPDDSKYNGLINMRVLNALTAPVGTSSVPILVFVRGAENLEYANPAQLSPDNTVYPIQSAAEVDTLEVGESNNGIVKERYLVNFGETVKSLRILMRRSILVEMQQDAGVTNAQNNILLQDTFSRFPRYFGYDTFGVHRAKGTAVPASNFNFNFTQTSVYNWMAPCFLAQKGSTMWHFLVDSNGANGNISVSRSPTFGSTATEGLVSSAATNRSGAAAFALANLPNNCGGAGVTHQLTNAGLSVGCPNYTNYKFESTNPQNTTNPSLATSSYDGSWFEMLRLNVAVNGNTTVAAKDVKIFKYFGVGSDFNLFFFINCPVTYRLPTVPASA
jgi:hypothetical protein